MTEEAEDGPDPNDVRRHARRMYTEMQYRQRYRRLDFYRPNAKQLEFHNLIVPERQLRANNQGGKTHAAGAQVAMDATQLYPEWYNGRRFMVPPKIERPFDFLAWCAAPTSVATRDGAQTKLLGNLMEDGGLGTGLIPLDNIVGKPAMARGIADFVDTATLRREDGGKALIRFKTYEMERRAFQGEPVDEAWIDEDDPNLAKIYGEIMARFTTTNGQLLSTMTPVLGLSATRKRFKMKHPGTAEVLMTIDDCRVSRGGHIEDEQIPVILARYSDSERQTRAYGADMQGEGAVFETPVQHIKYVRDPADFPKYWRWIWGLDFRHSGSETRGHPFAAALLCRDPDNDVIHVVHTVRLFGLAPSHVVAIKENPCWRAPAAWPHDGGVGAGIVTGETIAQTYKKLGLHMRPTHATFPTGGYNLNDGLEEMRNRFSSGRLKIAAHLAEAFDEYQGYHYVNNAVHKVDDDIMSAIRVGVMDIRFAQHWEAFQGFEMRRPNSSGLATGLDFPLFS